MHYNMQKDEEFFVCRWSVDETSGAPLLLLAGHNGVIRVLDCAHSTLVHVGACEPASKYTDGLVCYQMAMGSLSPAHDLPLCTRVCSLYFT